MRCHERECSIKRCVPSFTDASRYRYGGRSRGHRCGPPERPRYCRWFEPAGKSAAERRDNSFYQAGRFEPRDVAYARSSRFLSVCEKTVRFWLSRQDCVLDCAELMSFQSLQVSQFPIISGQQFITTSSQSLKPVVVVSVPQTSTQ